VFVVASLVVAAVAGALAIAASFSTAGRARSRRGLALLATVYAVLLARGGDAGGRSATSVGAAPRWRERVRGVQSPLRRLVTLGPSVPGPRCSVRAALAGSDTVVWLRVGSEHCPMAASEHWWVWVASPEPPREPGRPNPHAAAAAQGADLALDARWAWPAESPSPEGTSGLLRAGTGWIARLRQRAWRVGRGDDASAFVAATVLGARAGLAPARRRELRAAGLGHLIAISGLHVALAAWAAFGAMIRVAAYFGGRPRAGVVAALALVAGYVIVTGAPASAVRAGAMATLVALGAMVGRPAHGLTSLAIAVTSMLALAPAWLLDPGFQLSVAAMGAVVTGRAGASIFALTWRITWAIAPISILHFGTMSPWGLLANLVAIPVVTGWVLPLGLLGVPALSSLGAAAWAPAATGARLVLDLAALCDRLPTPSVPTVGVCALLLVVVGRGRSRSAAATRGRVAGWGRALAVSPWIYLATAGAAMVVVHRAAAVAPRWLAIGAGPRPWTTAFGPGSVACMEASPSSPARAMRLLEWFGVASLHHVTPPDDPAGAAVLRLAARRGFAVGEGDCRLPPRRQVVAALRRCAAVTPVGPPIVAQEVSGHMRCVTPGGAALLDFAGSR
jgi:ComEC/Rec2-related protein